MVAGSDRDRQTLNRCQCWQRRGLGLPHSRDSSTQEDGDYHTVGTVLHTRERGLPHSRDSSTQEDGGLPHSRDSSTQEDRGLPHSRDSSTREDGGYHTVGTAPHKRTGTTTQSGQKDTLTLTHSVWPINPYIFCGVC